MVIYFRNAVDVDLGKNIGHKMRSFFTIFLTFFASLTTAEPSSEVQTLMDRNLTIFDWGMYKLENRLRSNDINASVNYVWDENQVQISVVNFSSGLGQTMEESR